MQRTSDSLDRCRSTAGRMATLVAGAALAAATLLASLVIRGGGDSCTAAGPITAPEGRTLWISDSAIDDGKRLLLVIDPERKHAAVYHVDAAVGTLTLKSTRDIGWDLLIEDFNAQPPKPADLKKMLEVGAAPPARR